MNWFFIIYWYPLKWSPYSKEIPAMLLKLTMPFCPCPHCMLSLIPINFSSIALNIIWYIPYILLAYLLSTS